MKPLSEARQVNTSPDKKAFRGLDIRRQSHTLRPALDAHLDLHRILELRSAEVGVDAFRLSVLDQSQAQLDTPLSPITHIIFWDEP